MRRPSTSKGEQRTGGEVSGSEALARVLSTPLPKARGGVIDLARPDRVRGVRCVLRSAGRYRQRGNVPLVFKPHTDGSVTV